MIECTHPEETRFYANNARGQQQMLCGACGATFTLIHHCMNHMVVAVEDSEVIATHVMGDTDAECEAFSETPSFEELMSR